MKSQDTAELFFNNVRVPKENLLGDLHHEEGAIPPYDAVVLARRDFVRERPGVAEALVGLEGSIDAQTMRRLNREVDEAGRDPAAVAADFLEELGQATAESTTHAE